MPTDKLKKKRVKHSPRNKMLSRGVMKYSSARMFQKKALYKKIKPAVKGAAKPKAAGEKKPRVENRKPRNYLTQDNGNKITVKKTKCFMHHRKFLRKNITPGTVLILLTGPHRGKKVIFLKQLKSGLLLITGPYTINGCPMKRVHQKLVIATKTKLDLAAIQIPDRVTDAYFRKPEKARKSADNLYKVEKQSYVPSSERKEDQKSIDKQILEAVVKRKDKRLFAAYLRSMFALSKKDYPHKMMF